MSKSSCLRTARCARSICGISSPSRNQAVPKPVPRVQTNSSPLPWIAARPCTSASFSNLTGFANFLCIAAASGKPFQSWVPKCGALTTLPSLTMPGKPMVTQSNLPSGATRSVNALTICRGLRFLGVFTRTRGTRYFSRAEMTAAFRPVPPTSMQRMRLTAGTGAGPFFLLVIHHQVQGGVDQGDMGKCLGEIAQHALVLGIIFLGIEADVIGQPAQLAKQPHGRSPASHQGVIVCQPETAGQKRALARRQSVHTGIGLV